MFSLSAADLSDLRTLVKRAFQLRGNRLDLPIEFRADSSGLAIQAVAAGRALRLRLPGEFPSLRFVIPLSVLAACGTSRKGSVEFSLLENNQVAIDWRPAGIPRRLEVDQPSDVPAEFPGEAPRMVVQSPGFLDHLRDAIRTTSGEPSRFALNCLQFQGSQQRIVATDALQLLIQQECDLPWEEDLLVERDAALLSKELSTRHPLALGRTASEIVVNIGRWTFWLPIQREARFPRLEACLPGREAAACRLELGLVDRQRLVEGLPHLPGAKDGLVTLDLNGHVRLSAPAAGEALPTQWELPNSWTRGTPLRVTLKRSFLARALELGFDHVCFQTNDAPAFCQNPTRTYVAAVFSGTTALETETLAESKAPEGTATIPAREMVPA